MKLHVFLICTATGLLLGTGCTSEEIFSFVSGFPVESTFNIQDADGVWDENEEIAYTEIQDEVEDIVDEGFEIGEVTFEGVVLFVENQDPALTGVENVSLIFEDEFGIQTTVYDGVTISLPPGQTSVDSVVVTNLAEAGVAAMTDQIQAYVDQASEGTGDPNSSFRLISSGNSIPAGTPLAMDLTVQVRLGVEFFEEVEVPGFIGND